MVTEDGNNVIAVLVGLLIGSLVGALTMILLAPQSGQQTRKQIQDKSSELRDMTSSLVDDTMTQVRSKAKDFVTTGRQNFNELKQQGQDLAIEQLDHMSDAVKAGKTAVENS